MCADLLRLEVAVRALEEAGVELFHMDIMDGHFVPNFSLGPDWCRAVASISPVAQDVHLMIEDVDSHLDLFAGLPGLRIAFHPETSRHPVATIQRIRDVGGSPGFAVSPATPAGFVEHLLPLVEHVCVMTVNPGFAGQKLLPHCLHTVRSVREAADRLDLAGLDVAVDGNVSWSNIPRMIEAGANVLVAGTSSLFQPGARLAENVRRLRDLVSRTPSPA